MNLATACLAWELRVCVHQGSVLTHCSSSWCRKRFRASSALVCRGSFSALMYWWPGADRRHTGGVYFQARAWKAGMVSKELRVNTKKFLVAGIGLHVLKKSGKHPFAVCRSKLWVHKRCSGITDWLAIDPNDVYPRCNRKARPIDGRPMTQVDVHVTMLDVDATFCYQGEMLCSGRGCESAINARCCVACGKVQETIACPHHQAPLKVCDKVRGLRQLGCAPRIWPAAAPPKSPLHDPLDLWHQRPRRNTLGFTTQETWHWEYYGSLSKSATRVVWICTACHILLDIQPVTHLAIPGTRKPAKPRKTWFQCVKNDAGWRCRVPHA